MKDKVVNIVKESLDEVRDSLGVEGLDSVSEETRLFGSKGVLDSLGLVTLIASIEERVFDAFGRQVVLADEKAVSQKRSPFISVGRLAEYVCEQLQQGQ